MLSKWNIKYFKVVHKFIEFCGVDIWEGINDKIVVRPMQYISMLGYLHGSWVGLSILLKLFWLVVVVVVAVAVGCIENENENLFPNWDVISNLRFSVQF